MTNRVKPARNNRCPIATVAIVGLLLAPVPATAEGWSWNPFRAGEAKSTPAKSAAGKTAKKPTIVNSPQASGAAHEKNKSLLAGQPMRAEAQPHDDKSSAPSLWSKIGQRTRSAWDKTADAFTPDPPPKAKTESRFTMVGQMDEKIPPRSTLKKSWWQSGK